MGGDYQELDGFDEDWFDEAEELTDVLRDAMSDEFSGASPEEMDDALFGILESMSAAEAFNFTKALQQIGRGAGQALSDPVGGQIVRTSLPAGGAAAGMLLGGPAGSAVGRSLGTAGAGALPGKPVLPVAGAAGTLPGKPARPATSAPSLPISSADDPILKALILSQSPTALRSLLAALMGKQGKTSVNGVPVDGFLRMLSDVYGQAAANADELMYLRREGFDETSESFLDEALTDNQSLYASLIGAENAELAETEERW